MSPLFRKKPVVIEARPFDGTWNRACDLVHWIKTQGADAYCQEVACGNYIGLYIQTLEGQMQVGTGDFVIKGVRGEFYPCKADIFDATYEAAI
jgi:predicted RecB family nuclease